MHAGTAARYARVCGAITAHKAAHGRAPMVKELAAALGLTRGGISQMVGIMANRNMIRRTQVGSRVYVDVVE